MKRKALRGIEIGIICLLFSLLVLKLVLGAGVAVVLSGSMEPTISEDDLIVYVPKDGYKAGEVVVYQDEGNLTVHRIVKKSKTKVITQGDNNNAQDEPINENQIKGKYVFSIPKWGKIFGSKENLFSLNGVMAKYTSAAQSTSNAKVARLEAQIVNITTEGATCSLSSSDEGGESGYRFQLKKSGDTATRVGVDLISNKDIDSNVEITLHNETDKLTFDLPSIRKNEEGRTIYSFEDVAHFLPGKGSKTLEINFKICEGAEIEEYQKMPLSVKVRVSQVD